MLKRAMWIGTTTAIVVALYYLLPRPTVAMYLRGFRSTLSDWYRNLKVRRFRVANDEFVSMPYTWDERRSFLQRTLVYLLTCIGYSDLLIIEGFVSTCCPHNCMLCKQCCPSSATSLNWMNTDSQKQKNILRLPYCFFWGNSKNRTQQKNWSDPAILRFE